MKSLPLIVPDGCKLSADELADQAGRVSRLRPSVASVDRSRDALVVAFEPGVDRALLEEVVRTEQGCCTFLAIDYDDDARVLSIGAQDDEGREVVRRLAEFFEEGR
jgi:hypothetical protein